MNAPTRSAGRSSKGLVVDLTLRLGALDLAVACTVAPGEVVALVGPNGAGKTTLLRTIAGLQPIDTGSITLDGRVLTDTAAAVHLDSADRQVGVVFQEHRLFPHLSVRENIAFGPRARGVPASRARTVADDWLARVALTDVGDLRPAGLSGGQAQRAALARALASRPAVLLLDEPFAALDIEVRRATRQLVRTHLTDFAGPTVLVTHDPLEALTFADRLLVIEHGRVVQFDPPAQVTARPRSRWVAELVGRNLAYGTARGTEVVLDSGAHLTTADPAQGRVALVIPPRAIAVHRRPPGGSPRNVFRGRVVDLAVRGEHVRVRTAGPVPLVAEVTPAAVAELGLDAGSEVHLVVKATEVAVHREEI